MSPRARKKRHLRRFVYSRRAPCGPASFASVFFLSQNRATPPRLSKIFGMLVQSGRSFGKRHAGRSMRDLLAWSVTGGPTLACRNKRGRSACSRRRAVHLRTCCIGLEVRGDVGCHGAGIIIPNPAAASVQNKSAANWLEFARNASSSFRES